MTPPPLPATVTREEIARVLWGAQRPDADRIDFDRIDHVSLDGWRRMADAVLSLLAEEREACAGVVRAEIEELTDELSAALHPDTMIERSAQIESCAHIEAAIRARGAK